MTPNANVQLQARQRCCYALTIMPLSAGLGNAFVFPSDSKQRDCQLQLTLDGPVEDSALGAPMRDAR